MSSIKLAFPLLFIITLLSCNQDKKTSSNTKEFTIKPLRGFFSKNDLEFKKPTKNVVITNQKEFDTYFGVAQTMRNTIPDINFDNHNIVAFITKPANTKKIVEISSSEIGNDTLKVTYNVVDGGKQSYASNNIKIFEIPKSVQAVQFHSGEDTEVVEI